MPKIFTFSNTTDMNIKELLNQTDRFAANAGCRITEVGEHQAVAEMTVTAEHLNGGNVCQGGALFTLADLAIAALMNYSGQLTFGISNSIMYVSSAHEGDHLRAEAVHVANRHKPRRSTYLSRHRSRIQEIGSHQSLNEPLR